jgi:bifunctional DNase/RNase
VILLKECAGDRVLPIWVSAGEGDVIAALLERIPFVRPSTFDVAARLLEIGKMNIEKVAVTSLRKNVFFGSIWIRAGENVQEIDARPSDAITLALKAKAAIFVTTETFEQASAFVLRAGSELSQLDTEQRKYLAEGKAEPEAREMEWRSLAHNRAGQGHG